MTDLKKYVKTYCAKRKCYGLITIDSNDGRSEITNFYEIDDDTAKNIQTSLEGELPAVSSHLKPCEDCGSRTPKCCDKAKHCKVKNGELWYQCLYCSGLEICQEGGSGSADIYFLMDESGSMSYSDRVEGANAVRKMIQSLQGQGNIYSFVAWGSNAGYLFKGETDSRKISSALVAYENDTTGYGGSTAADIALRLIISEVGQSKKSVKVIFVTDGGFDDNKMALQARNDLLACKKDIEILAIGVTGAIQSSLDMIGTVPKFSKVIGSSSNLTSTFEQIAEMLKKKGNNI